LIEEADASEEVYTSSLDLEAYRFPAVGKKEKPSACEGLVVEMLRVVEKILPSSQYFLGHTPKPAPVGV
jgi:hypothetical protein